MVSCTALSPFLKTGVTLVSLHWLGTVDVSRLACKISLRGSTITSASSFSSLGGSWLGPHALFGLRFSSYFLTPAVVTSISGISGGLGPVGGGTSVSVLENMDEYWLLGMFALPCVSEISTPDLNGETEQMSFFLDFK